MIESAFPIISTPDLTRALGFYENLLGGTITYRFPDDGDPQYVGMELGSLHIGIGADSDIDAGTVPQRFSLWIYSTTVTSSSTPWGLPALPSSRNRSTSLGANGWRGLPTPLGTS